jgi:hypothetical protein
MNSDDYRSHIDRLIREMTGETVLNGSSAHASIIIERMFANATASVAILSRGFDPRIYGSYEAIEQAELLLGDPNRSISILLENVEAETISSHPFVARLGAYLDRGNLSIRKLPTHLADAVGINFAIMDETGYRIERDKTQAVAVASFGDVNFTTALRKFYSRLWERSELVSVKLAA